MSEYNTDVLERSYYFDRGAEPIGRLSLPFVRQVAGALAPLIAGGGGADRPDALSRTR